MQLDGTVAGTGFGPLNHASNYDGDYTVTANYHLTLNNDGTVDYSPDKTYVVLVGVSKDHLTTQTTNKIPITRVALGGHNKVTSFELEGDNWYSNAARDGVGESWIKGNVNVDPRNPHKGTGSYEAGYINAGATSFSNASVSNYTFTTDSTQQPGAAKNGRGGNSTPFEEKVQSHINDSKSIDYDSTTRLLSILEDSIITTPSASDPLLGAKVTFPEFQFEGFTADGKIGIFWATDDRPYSVSEGDNIFEQAAIPILYYDTNSNLFYAPLDDNELAGMSPASPFFNSNLSGASSPFLNFIASILDPSSPDFDPNAIHYVTISPNSNYLALTNSFTTTGDIGGYDMEFAANPTPESSSLVLMGLGIAAILGVVCTRRCRL